MHNITLMAVPGLQCCAQQIIGQHDVEWPSPYYIERTRKVRNGGEVETVTEKEYLTCCAMPGGPQLFDWHKPYRWFHARGFNQMHIDGFTFDAKELAQKKNTAIKSRGAPQVPWQNKLTEAAVGNLPKFLVYLVVHCLLGMFAYFTWSSASGGHKDTSFSKFKFWYYGLPEAHEEHLKGNYYYNHPQAIRKLPQDVKTADFQPENFLVCPLLLSSIHTSFCLQ